MGMFSSLCLGIPFPVRMWWSDRHSTYSDRALYTVPLWYRSWCSLVASFSVVTCWCSLSNSCSASASLPRCMFDMQLLEFLMISRVIFIIFSLTSSLMDNCLFIRSISSLRIPSTLSTMFFSILYNVVSPWLVLEGRSVMRGLIHLLFY